MKALQITQSLEGRQTVYDQAFQRFTEGMQNIEQADRKVGNYLVVVNILGGISGYLLTKVMSYATGLVACANTVLLVMALLVYFAVLLVAILALRQRNFLGWPTVDIYAKLLCLPAADFWKYLYTHFLTVAQINEAVVTSKRRFIQFTEVFFLVFLCLVVILTLVNFAGVLALMRKGVP